MRRVGGRPCFPVVGSQPAPKRLFKGLGSSLKLRRRRRKATVTQPAHQHGGGSFIRGHLGQDGDQNPMRNLEPMTLVEKLSS